MKTILILILASILTLRVSGGELSINLCTPRVVTKPCYVPVRTYCPPVRYYVPQRAYQPAQPVVRYYTQQRTYCQPVVRHYKARYTSSGVYYVPTTRYYTPSRTYNYSNSCNRYSR